MARADQFANLLRNGRVFESASKGSAAVISGSATFFSVFAGKKKRYDSPPDPALRFGNLFVSDDGDTVVWMLADHFYGNHSDYSKLAALVFYKKGVPIKQCSLAELLVRTRLVSQSVSHTDWILKHRQPGPSAVVFAPDGSRLEFETTSLRHYIFDPKTGAFLVSEDSPLWKGADLIVYAEIVNLKVNQLTPPLGSVWESTNYHITKGDPKMVGRIRFEDPTWTYQSGWSTVALKKTDRGQGWVTTGPAHQIPVLYNALP